MASSKPRVGKSAGSAASPAPTNPRAFAPASLVITANRLADGVVVFLGHDFHWVRSLQDAFVLPTAAGESVLLRAKADEDRQIIVEPYAVDVLQSDGTIRAKALREAIRAGGPTVRPDLNKHSAS